ncbi:MAG: type I glutamate--ammonia ligase [Candidatus Anammoxibacter sp.]
MKKKIDNDTIIEKAKEDNVLFVLLQFTDINGSIKSVTIPVHKLPEALEKGIWFDGSSIDGFTRICESDMYLKPDPDTYSLLPWEPKDKAAARFLCDVFMPDGSPFEGDPRYILKRAVKEAEQLGYICNIGPELEFFLFKPREDHHIEPSPHDIGSYFDFSRDLASNVRRDIIIALEKMGLEIEMSHHEVAAGQHEIDFKYGPALRTADNAVTFKQAVKSIAHQHGIYATFMPKPIFGTNGSGMHCHQSLCDIKTGDNLFYDSTDEYKLSKLARQFVAGQLLHIKSMISILAPNVNSYKRLVPGFEAPVYICWGQKNRSALIRIPRYSPGREQATRAELRCPDPSNNPYMAFAVMIAAGLDGIKNDVQIPDPVDGNVYEFDSKQLANENIEALPGSLEEAVKELKKSDLMKKALGPHTYDIFIKAKELEWNEYKTQVTSWEHKKYFETT